MTKLNINVVPSHFAKSAYVYRQVAATFAASLLSVTGGITFGFTAVLIPQLKEDVIYPYDQGYDTWIASISPLAMMLGCVFAGSMSDGLGRRMGQIVVIIPFTIGWIMMGLANDNTIILIGRFITGLCTGAVRPSSMVYIGELTDPKYRSIALFCPSMTIHVGCLISHVVGKYVYWKTSCFIFIIPNVISLIILICLKESPLWLIGEGKIDEGIESFRLFRGHGEESEKELEIVLEKRKEKTDVDSSFRDIMKILLSKPFLNSMMIVCLLFIAMQWCGINTLSFYAQQIFDKTFSGDLDAFLLMIGTDIIRVLAAVVVCVFATVMPRKPTFVGCCFGTTFVLFGLVIYLFIRPDGLVWIAILFMVLYIAIASAITIISWSFAAEIFPAKVRGLGSGISSSISFALLFVSVKVTPQIIRNFGDTGMYGVFGLVTLVTGVVLMYVLPETNGKSLQDIEDELYKKNNNNDSTTTVP